MRKFDVHCKFVSFSYIFLGGAKSKSARRKLKDSTWWLKQKEKEKSKQITSEESKRTQPCKYYLNGNCKNVSCSIAQAYMRTSCY